MIKSKNKIRKNQDLILNRDILLDLIIKFSLKYMPDELLKTISLGESAVFLENWIDKNYKPIWE
jgi:hypothetical protein